MEIQIDDVFRGPTWPLGAPQLPLNRSTNRAKGTDAKMASPDAATIPRTSAQALNAPIIREAVFICRNKVQYETLTDFIENTVGNRLTFKMPDLDGKKEYCLAKIMGQGSIMTAPYETLGGGKYKVTLNLRIHPHVSYPFD